MHLVSYYTQVLWICSRNPFLDLHCPSWIPPSAWKTKWTKLALNKMLIVLTKEIYKSIDDVQITLLQNKRRHQKDWTIIYFVKFISLKMDYVCIYLRVYYTIPFGFTLFRHFLAYIFNLFQLLSLAKYHWRGFSTRNAHMVHIVN